jgi:hypothetical protein
MVDAIVNVKLVPAVRAVMTGDRKLLVGLHVTPSLVPRLWSTVMMIWLFAVTAEVSTTSVGPTPVGSATLPAAAEPQAAGDEMRPAAREIVDYKKGVNPKEQRRTVTFVTPSHRMSSH